MRCGPALALFDGIGVSEMLLVVAVSVLVYGGKLPEVMRNLGRGYARLRHALGEMGRPLREEIQRVTTLPPEAGTPSVAPPGSSLPLTGPPTPYGLAPAPGPPPPPASAPAAAGPWPLPPPQPPGPALFPGGGAGGRAPQAPTDDPFDEPPPV